ncbi:HAMP domain-containing sensor histidine kinase [Corallococcus sp. BB11-1]|uniref:sensor histidine kinase n=1 Tax=Corallococcus sp. BB11-1 TaxID=2996783 RepID=UPI002270E8F4|nr:HAMP domain-containing sensor histidine kinase [Corallococcus sp. BB11-1]MCY1032933.1 HAMP domain-containing sensor histidine kinase [Corallococcus sp. BB11-1]
MNFLEDLKEYLQKIRSAPARKTSSAPFTPDSNWVHTTFIELLERLDLEQPKTNLNNITDIHRTWSKDERTLRYSAALATLLQENFLHEAPPDVIKQHIRIALARQLGLNEAAATLARDLELARLSNIAWHSVMAPQRAQDSETPDYALEIRAARAKHGGIELAPIGDVFLSLTGRDAIHWLLHIEMAQSTGPTDVWRLSRSTAEHLLMTPEEELSTEAWDYEPLYHWRIIRRLGKLGILTVLDDGEYGGDSFGYRLLPNGKRILEELLAPNGSPFSVLAATLSQDEAMAALDRDGKQGGLGSNFDSSAVATARQARLVVHEIRNALIPARIALGSLYSSIVGSQSEAALERFRPRIDPGIDRALKFVTDLLKTSELVSRVPEAFDLLRSLADAVSSLSTPLRIHLKGTTDLPALSGYRERFVLAIVNLLRNAEQAGAQQVLIESVLEDNNRNILLTVDDDGPGIPAADRERIFQRGISLRSGGAGEGLALVKEVVEIELRGKIACVDKPDGGARFRMRLPVAERTPR